MSTRERLATDIKTAIYSENATDEVEAAVDALADKIVYRDQLEEIGFTDEYGPVYRELPK